MALQAQARRATPAILEQLIRGAQGSEGLVEELIEGEIFTGHSTEVRWQLLVGHWQSISG